MANLTKRTWGVKKRHSQKGIVNPAAALPRRVIGHASAAWVASHALTFSDWPITFMLVVPTSRSTKEIKHEPIRESHSRSVADVDSDVCQRGASQSACPSRRRCGIQETHRRILRRLEQAEHRRAIEVLRQRRRPHLLRHRADEVQRLERV